MSALECTIPTDTDGPIEAPWNVERYEGWGAVTACGFELVSSPKEVACELTDKEVCLGQEHRVDGCQESKLHIGVDTDLA